MALASSSSPIGFPAADNLNQHKWKYDVFLSFRGEDTRGNFVSHLLAALTEKGVETFIDYQLRKGDEIAAALLQAIEESNVAVVVFSQDYASSSWCLDELVKIMECRETHGLIVIPVFYHVDPSDVRKQTGSFAEYSSDRKRKRNFEIYSEKVPKWKAALTAAASLSGWDSKAIRLERQLIDQIVNDILEKLNQAFPSSIGLESLVGINSRLEQIKSVLSIGSPDVRILGIWGMGGIGKTTIAEVIFTQISCQFDGCCFLKNVREELEKSGKKKLLEELISKTLGDSHIRIDTSSIRPGLFLIRRLCHKQILVVLDDVDDPLLLEYLVGVPCWFGRGSRIVVTSRNRHAFEKMTNYIYEAQALNHDEALQLFNKNAFKPNHSLEDHMALSDLAVSYCRGNPLALKVLGSFLFGKNENEWESALDKLKKVPMMEIQNVLKISYNGLDRQEREIFLHIACFFKGEKKDFVQQILISCGFSTHIGIKNLIDKSLITTIGDRLEMHDLLQEMGREIVREETNEPGKRSRLWDSDDIYQVFMKNTGTAKVEGIFLNMSKVRRDIHLNPKAFEKMFNLKFLKFYIPEYVEGLKEDNCMVYLSHGLDFLPDELRYLHWDRYPLEYLPANFCPENLLCIELPRSNIKGLQNESEPLSIFNHYSSPSQFNMVTCLRLKNCKELMSLPNNVDMRCLDTLDLTGCSRLELFPEISRTIKYLYLSWTAIKVVPFSVENLDQLLELNLSCCTKLESLPTNICKLKCLESFDLYGCHKLKKFPEILENMDNLESLNLDWTGIEDLPSSVDNLKGLKSLSMWNCRELAFFPQSLSNLKGLEEFKIALYSGSTHEKEKHVAIKFIGQDHGNSLLPSWAGMSCVTSLVVTQCNIGQLTANLGFLSSLEELDLSGNNFESIPESIKQLTRLHSLCIEDCQRLQSLPELPASLSSIEAMGCTSLENISSINQLLSESEHLPLDFNFSGCFMLDKNERDPISWLRNLYFVESLKDILHDWLENNSGMSPYLSICYPGSKIPEWFEYQNTGDSIKIPLPSNWLNNDFLGFALCFVVEDTDFEDLVCHCHFGYDCDHDNTSGSTFALECEMTDVLSSYEFIHTEHVLLFYGPDLYRMIAENARHLTQRSYDAVLIHFRLLSPLDSSNKVKKCGVIPWYAQTQDDKYDSSPMRELSDSSSSHDSDADE